LKQNTNVSSKTSNNLLTVVEATRHCMCSKCFPLTSTHELRQTRHWSIAWSMMLWWIPDQASIRRSFS